LVPETCTVDPLFKPTMKALIGIHQSELTHSEDRASHHINASPDSIAPIAEGNYLKV
jgi:hypothetical protein